MEMAPEFQSRKSPEASAPCCPENFVVLASTSLHLLSLPLNSASNHCKNVWTNWAGRIPC